MKKKAMEFNVSGLKCDNPLCDYKDMSILSSRYKQYVNAPCPKCGENLLTEADYKSLKVLRGIARFVNFIYFFIPKSMIKKDRATMKVTHDGSGVPTFGPIEIIKEEVK
jgi:hypothetical protein